VAHFYYYDSTPLYEGESFFAQGLGRAMHWSDDRGDISSSYLSACVIDGTQYGTFAPVDVDDKYTLPTARTLTIFPNPTNGSIRIQIKGVHTGTISLTLYDMMGRIAIPRDRIPVSSGDVDIVLNSLTLGSLKSGVYIVGVTSESKIEFAKFTLLK